MAWIRRAMFLAVLWVCTVLAHAGKSADDTACSVPEHEWFEANMHIPELLAWAKCWNGVRDVHVLDCFGFSGSVAKAWTKKSFRSLKYDILLDSRDDVVSKCGFYRLLDAALSIVERGFLMAGPPCSLMVSACASVHQRSFARPDGNLANRKVRLSNLIWDNFAVLLLLLTALSRRVHYAIEQPAQGHLKTFAQMFAVTTWMAFYGSDLAKPSHILTNLRTMTSLTRKMSKHDRLFFAARLRRRNRQRKHPRVYHCKITKPNGETGWQDQKDFPSSAAYTPQFAQALFDAWIRHYDPSNSMSSEEA